MFASCMHAYLFNAYGLKYDLLLDRPSDLSSMPGMVMRRWDFPVRPTLLQVLPAGILRTDAAADGWQRVASHQC